MTLAPHILPGAALAAPPARPAPYPRPVTVYRDAMTGHFAPAPVGQPLPVVIAPQPQPELLTLTRTLDYGDGSAPEVVTVTVQSLSARAARFLGDLSAASVADFETELGLATFRELAPARAHEVETEQMHRAHRSDKARRGAVSKKRNAQARAKDAARKAGPL